MNDIYPDDLIGLKAWKEITYEWLIVFNIIFFKFHKQYQDNIKENIAFYPKYYYPF